MLRLGIVFLVIALIAGVFNVYQVEAISIDLARWAFFIFLILAVVSIVFGSRRPVSSI